MKARKRVAIATVVLFYLAILPPIHAEYFNYRAHNVTGDGTGNISGFANLPTPYSGKGTTVDNSAVVDVRAYGAGVDNTGAQNATAFQAAYAELPATGGAIYVPPIGTFNVSNTGGFAFTVSSKDRVTIFSDGPGATIRFTDNTGLLSATTVNNLDVYGLRIAGNLSNSQRYVGNEQNGRIWLSGVSYADIRHNTWDNVSQALFISTGSDIKFHHNTVLRAHSAVQSSSIFGGNAHVTNNYFLGHTFSSADIGSDDLVAFFNGDSIIISENIMDKAGPTAYNQATAIDIGYSGSGTTVREAIVSRNIIRGVISTNATSARTAIKITGASGEVIKRVLISENIIKNSNKGIEIETYAEDIDVINNIIDNTVVLAGYSNSGTGIISSNSEAAHNRYMGNRITNSGKNAIQLVNTDNVTVSFNEARICTDDCYWFSQSENVTFIGNVADGSASDGVFTYNAANFISLGNRIINNGAYGVVRGGDTKSGGISLGDVFANNTSGNINHSFGLTTETWQEQLTGTASLDFAAIADNVCETKTMTVTGAVSGNVVALGIPNALAATDNTTYTAWVSADNTVTVRRCNTTGATSPDPAAATVRAVVWKY